MNSKYQNGKIYCIWSYETDEIYIGSTILSLDDRFKKHQNKYNLFLNNNFNFISSFEILKYKNAQIGIIEEYPCNTKLELHRREGELQKKIKCVNRHIAGRSRKEFYKDNKDILLEKQKIYYENNKEHINKKNKKYYENNKEELAKKKIKYRQKNKEQIDKKRKEYYENNKEHINKKNKEFYEAHKKEAKEYKKIYNLKNKEKIQNYKKEKFNCECGGKYTRSDKSKHSKTILHQKYLEQQQQ